MALVQTSQSSPLPSALSSQASESLTSSGSNQYDRDSGSSAFSYELPRQPMVMTGNSHQHYANFNDMMLGSAGSHLHPQHSQPQQQSPSFYPTSQLSAASLFNQQPPIESHSSRTQSPSMHLHQFNRPLQQQQNSIHSVPVPHGFMSSFLLGEKEKMTAAATAMLLKQQQLASSAGTTLPPPSTVAAISQQQLPPQVAGGASQSNQQHVSAPSNNNDQSSQQSTSSSLSSINPKGPGGLMPSMMAPLSRMPDNALGQAYGAAVGIALPAESGRFPGSLAHYG